jgi:predicted PurR-regulated permease PerM
MTDRLSPLLRTVLFAAGVVVIMWGVMQAQHLLLIVLISLFLAYAVAPLPRWLIHRYRLTTNAAVTVTLIALCVAYAVIAVLLVFTAIRIQQKLPFYHAQYSVILAQFSAFADAHNFKVDGLLPSGTPNAERVIEFLRANLPTLAGLVSDRVLIWLLSLLFLAEIAEQDESKRGVFAAGLAHYGGEVQSFIAVMAKTGAIHALANLVLYVALGVDFPVLWCVLSFLMSFIPNLGFFISLVPPVLLALIKFGWTRAILVVLGLVLIDVVVEYVIQPKFMKKGLEISFLNVTLSLMFWGYLLGLWGAVLAIPLTLAIRKFIAQPTKGEAIVDEMLAEDGTTT